MLYYPRAQLACELADALQGKTLFSDAPNGLFLAAEYGQPSRWYLPRI